MQSAILFVMINRSCEKRLKIFEYQKNNIHYNGLFFCKKHSHLHKTFNAGKMISKSFWALKSLYAIDKKSYEIGQILITDA